MLAIPGAPSPMGRLAVRVTDVLRLTLALFALTNLGRIPGVSSGARDVPILVNDLMVVAVLAFGCVAALRTRRAVLDRPAVMALVFMSVGGLSALLAVPRFELSLVEFLVSIAYLARWGAYFGLYLVIINAVPDDQALAIWRTLERSILCFAGFGIVQSLFLPGFAQMVDPDGGWDVQGHRLVSTLLDPNLAGALILFPLLVYCGMLSFGERVRAWKIAVCFAALLMTVSRSSMLGFATGLTIVVLARGVSKRLAMIGTGVVLVLLPFLPLLWEVAASFGRFSLEGSAAARVISWLRAIQIFVANPVLGVGFNTYGFAQRAYGFQAIGRFDFAVDGGLLFIAVMTGAVGLAVYLGMLYSVLARCRTVWRNALWTGEERGLALGTAAVTGGIVVHSVFVNSLLLPFVMEALWVVWAVTFLVLRYRLERSPGKPAARGSVPRLVVLPAANRR